MERFTLGQRLLARANRDGSDCETRCEFRTEAEEADDEDGGCRSERRAPEEAVADRCGKRRTDGETQRERPGDGTEREQFVPL